MPTLHYLDIAAHITFGALGLLVGLVPILSRKGSRRHRKGGNLFVVAASFVILFALLTFVVGYHASAVVDASLILSAGYQLAGGVRALYLRDRGPSWFDAGMACTALGVAAVLISLKDSAYGANTSYTFTLAVAWVSAVALYDLSRHAWPTYWLRNVRPLDHGLKLTSVFFAMLSAASGNLLKTWQPWSIVVPNIAGPIVMILLAATYVRRFRHLDHHLLDQSERIASHRDNMPSSSNRLFADKQIKF